MSALLEQSARQATVCSQSCERTNVLRVSHCKQDESTTVEDECLQTVSLSIQMCQLSRKMTNVYIHDNEELSVWFVTQFVTAQSHIKIR